MANRSSSKRPRIAPLQTFVLEPVTDPAKLAAANARQKQLRELAISTALELALDLPEEGRFSLITELAEDLPPAKRLALVRQLAAGLSARALRQLAQELCARRG